MSPTLCLKDTRVHSTKRELSQAEMWYFLTWMTLKIGAFFAPFGRKQLSPKYYV